MKAKVYLETSVVSYLTARPSRDLVRAAQQQVTRDWWERRADYEIHISQLVLDEAAAGDPDAARQRLLALRGLNVVTLTIEAQRIAAEILNQKGMPAKAAADAIHVGLAAAHGIKHLLTWNCTHIANPFTRGSIEDICRAQGFVPPIICTPFDFSGE